MRNSDNLMRISHFLISLIRTWEKEVITLIEVPVDKGILSLFFKYGWLYVVFLLLLCNRFFLPLFTTLQEMGFIFTKRQTLQGWLTQKAEKYPLPIYLDVYSCVGCSIPLAFLQRNSLGMNSLLFMNCSVFCDVRHVWSSILGQYVMFRKFYVRIFNVQSVQSSVFWCLFQD